MRVKELEENRLMFIIIITHKNYIPNVAAKLMEVNITYMYMHSVYALWCGRGRGASSNNIFHVTHVQYVACKQAVVWS